MYHISKTKLAVIKFISYFTFPTMSNEKSKTNEGGLDLRSNVTSSEQFSQIKIKNFYKVMYLWSSMVISKLIFDEVSRHR
jgi:hypothetical protein